MIRRPPRSTQSRSSAASDVYKRQRTPLLPHLAEGSCMPVPSGESVFATLEPHLARVQKPIQYVGGELNSVSKVWADTEVRWALMYPDAYEVGLPNQGVQILYEILNERDG